MKSKTDLIVGKIDSTNRDEDTFSTREQNLRLAKMEEEIESIKQDRKQRKPFSVALFIFMGIYVIIAVLIVIGCGLELLHLSDTVIITMLTTTLANIISIFSFVAKYLYRNK